MSTWSPRSVRGPTSDLGDADLSATSSFDARLATAGDLPADDGIIDGVLLMGPR